MIFGKKFRPAVAAALIFSALISAGCKNRTPKYAAVSSSAGEVRLRISDINDGKVRFFTYSSQGKQTDFFIRKDGKGALSAYFDACFTCYKHKKGYRIEGENLVCNECSMKFRIADEKWDNSGGCSPILLKSRIEGDYFIIQAQDLEKGSRLF